MLKDNLLMLRSIHGFSQEDVAERVGISRQAYAKWESGATIPDVEKCARLAHVYDTTVDALLRTEEMDDGRVLPPAPKGKNIWGSVCVNERGQIVIPRAARDHFGLRAGQRLILGSDDDEGFVLIPAEIFERKIELMNQILSPAGE